MEVELPWGVRGPREGEVATFLAAHLATRGLTCLLVVDDLWDRYLCAVGAVVCIGMVNSISRGRRFLFK